MNSSYYIKYIYFLMHSLTYTYTNIEDNFMKIDRNDVWIE